MVGQTVRSAVTTAADVLVVVLALAVLLVVGSRYLAPADEQAAMTEAVYVDPVVAGINFTSVPA